MRDRAGNGCRFRTSIPRFSAASPPSTEAVVCSDKFILVMRSKEIFDIKMLPEFQNGAILGINDERHRQALVMPTRTFWERRSKM